MARCICAGSCDFCQEANRDFSSSVTLTASIEIGRRNEFKSKCLETVAQCYGIPWIRLHATKSLGSVVHRIHSPSLRGEPAPYKCWRSLCRVGYAARLCSASRRGSIPSASTDCPTMRPHLSLKCIRSSHVAACGPPKPIGTSKTLHRADHNVCAPMSGARASREPSGQPIK